VHADSAPDPGGPRPRAARAHRLPHHTPTADGCPDNPACIAGDRQLRAAVLALADPDLRTRFAAAARRSVLRRIWSTVGDELIADYRDVTRHLFGRVTRILQLGGSCDGVTGLAEPGFTSQASCSSPPA